MSGKARTMASPLTTKPEERDIILHKSDPAHKKGLRTVAAFEFTKGALGIIIGLGVVALVHRDLWDVMESVLEFLHINTDRHFAQVLLDLADRVTDNEMWTIATGAFTYSTLRFIEAYGLWKTRIWAEWLAILSGMVYMPFEVHGILSKSTPVRWALLVINLALVLYVTWVRISGWRSERRARLRQQEPQAG